MLYFTDSACYAKQILTLQLTVRAEKGIYPDTNCSTPHRIALSSLIPQPGQEKKKIQNRPEVATKLLK